jgi:hypothetical protein
MKLGPAVSELPARSGGSRAGAGVGHALLVNMAAMSANLGRDDGSICVHMGMRCFTQGGSVVWGSRGSCPALVRAIRALPRSGPSGKGPPSHASSPVYRCVSSTPKLEGHQGTTNKHTHIRRGSLQ